MFDLETEVVMEKTLQWMGWREFFVI